MKLYKQPVVAMSIINPMFCRNHSIQIELEQSDEGSIPHVHVYHDHTRNPKKCSYIRLDKAKYSTHHDIIPLPRKARKEFIECMTSDWKKHIVEYSDGITTRTATGYEAAVDIWVETYENGNYGKFNLDNNGIPIMPDYSKL